MATHKNKWTGEELDQEIEVCSGCHKNFLDTPAGDAHRNNYACLTPTQANLKALVNKFGSIIYARKRAKKPYGYKTLTRTSEKDKLSSNASN